MRKTAYWIVVVFLAVLIVPGTAQERGFDTPEACAQAFFAALRAQDVEAMEACVAFDEMAASYDYQAQAERMGTISPAVLLPAHDAFAVAYNCASLKGSWYKRLEAFNLITISPALETVYLGYRTIPRNDDAFADALEDIAQLAGFNVYALMHYEGILTPDEIPVVKDKYYSENVQKSIQRELVVWGIDTYADIAIAFSVAADTLFPDGTQYIIPLRLLEIGGRWLVFPGTSTISYFLSTDVNSILAELP